jgi:hypothetical protein
MMQQQPQQIMLPSPTLQNQQGQYGSYPFSPWQQFNQFPPGFPAQFSVPWQGQGSSQWPQQQGQPPSVGQNSGPVRSQNQGKKVQSKEKIKGEREF